MEEYVEGGEQKMAAILLYETLLNITPSKENHF